MPDIIVHSTMHNDLNQWCSVSDNPFTAPTTLHPNSTGDVSASWVIEGYPYKGAVLMWGNCAIGHTSRTAPIILDVSVEQNGVRTGATVRLVNGGCAEYRAGFTSDGSPYRLTYKARLEHPDHFPGSVFEIGPIQVFNPIVDSNTPWLHQLLRGDSGALTSCNQGGLMNRIIPLMSLMAIGRMTGRSVYAFWGKNQHCAANLDDIFDLPARTDPSNVADNFEICSNYEERPPLRLDEGARNKLIYSIRPVRTSNPTIESSDDDIAQEFKRIPLSVFIKKEIEKFKNVDFSNTIALHIRRPFPNGVFAEQEQSKFTLEIDVFLDLIKNIKLGAPKYKNILLCTNSPEFEKEIREKFGEYIFVYEKTTVDNTVDYRAVQEAVVDINLMSRCPVMFSQETTAFGHFAHVLGRNKLFCITKKTDIEKFNFWQFDRGIHIGENSSKRSEFGAMETML